MAEEWLARWAEGRTGWHEPGGNAGLRSCWPDFEKPGRVLVPLCGKTPDLKWLAGRGHDVTGVELSRVAVEGFFDDNGLDYEREQAGLLTRYSANAQSITIYCGDYFDFESAPFDALYDRGAIVALPRDLRPRYVAHTKKLLNPGAVRLIVTLEYDQSVVDGPPYSVPAEEVTSYWDDLAVAGSKDEIDTCPPKFRQAGILEMAEIFWLSH